MSLAPFKASQLLDRRAVINQFLLILVRIAHFKRLASIFSSISRISSAAISNSRLHFTSIVRVFICLDPRVSSEATLYFITNQQIATPQRGASVVSSSFRTSLLYISDETSKTLMWQLHTMASFSSSRAVWNASAKRSYANEPRRNEHKGPLWLHVYY